MTALGEMSIVLEKLESLLVANTIFVAQCELDGLVPANQVLWHRYGYEFEGEVEKPTDLKRPFIVIKMDTFEWHEHSTGCMMPKCQPKIHIQDRYRGATFKESAIEFSNFVGQLMEEFTENSMQPGGFVIRKITQSTDPTAVARRDESDQFKFWFTEYDISLGADVEGGR